LIKTLLFLRPVRNDEHFKKLEQFFEAIGLERSESFSGRQHRGTRFLTPQAAIEVVSGPDFPAADFACEVADANTAYDAVTRGGFKVADELADRDFGARMFIVEPVTGTKVAVYSYLPEKRPEPVRTVEGSMDAKGRRFGIVVSRFNSFITDRLLQGALDCLQRSGAKHDDLTIVRVPGAFEIPSAARTLAESKRVDAVICLGCLIRGETSHFDHIATETTRGIGQSAQDTGIPHAYGVLTCDTLEQAIDRAGLKAGNKGFEAAMAAIEMANMTKAVGSQS
jgi:6,7-dimethyl-8-ribityllumazine synthase